MGTAMALLQTALMSGTYWAKATLTAVYLINRLPTPVLQQMTPYQKLLGRAPDYNFLRVFGSLCYPWLRPYASNKLQARCTSCVFLWYRPLTKGYRRLDKRIGIHQ